MKLEKLYKKAVDIGIANDPRGKTEIKKILNEEKEKFDTLKKDELDFYDKDRLFNPFADSRILNGDLDINIKTVVVGIDMQVGEILLTYLLNKDFNKKIDLIISHHPEGYALAQLHEVMKLQADLMAAYGVNISVAEQLMEKRISEVQRRLLPINHTRAVDAACALGIPMMCIHTPADNCVTTYLKKTFDRNKPAKLKDLMDILKKIPEYKKSAALQVPPKIVNGSENNKCGKIYIEMTGGTEGAKEIMEKYATSDVLGLNLLFDEIEKEEKLRFVGISGFQRIRRKN
jgi:hypothetical protein